MIVKSIRYGETSGVCCGPVSGPSFVEVMVYDDKGISHFIQASVLDISLMIIMSEYPLFDIMYTAHNSVAGDFEKEYKKAQKLMTKEEEYNLSDDEPEGYGHYFPGFEKAVNLAVYILKECGDESVIEKYLDEKLDNMEIPTGPYYDEDVEE